MRRAAEAAGGGADRPPQRAAREPELPQQTQTLAQLRANRERNREGQAAAAAAEAAAAAATAAAAPKPAVKGEAQVIGVHFAKLQADAQHARERARAERVNVEGCKEQDVRDRERRERQAVGLLRTSTRPTLNLLRVSV